MKHTFTLFFYCIVSFVHSQTYIFHESHISNDSLRIAIISDPIQNIYPVERRPCTIQGNVLGKDSLYCTVTTDIFNPSVAPCGIQNLYTFDCYDSLERVVFGSFISQNKYRGNYIIHYPSGYVHVTMTLDKNGISGPVYHYYDIPTDKYVGKTYDKGSLMVELEYKNSLIWNVKKLLDKNGKPLKQGNFRNGNGTLNIYRENGTLLRTVELTNGSLNGICTYYYSTGQILMQGKYLNNFQEGIWYEYDISGKIVAQPEYAQGEVIKWN